jgi:high-affinity iron transporter
MNFADALPTFVVTLREGVEAALVVGIVLAYLKKANQPQLNRWVYSGIAVGAIASVLVGILFSSLLVWLDAADGGSASVVKQFLEGAFGVVAIALLSWMLVWMTQQARGLKAEVEGSITAALKQANAGWGVFGLVMIAVLREGFETVLFIAAQFQQGWMPVLGAVTGLTGAVIIGFLLFQLGIKINLRQFFLGMGVLLLLIVAGLVVSALRHFDAAIALLTQIDPRFANLCFSQDSCILGPQLWDLSGVLPDRQFPGILLKALLGYTQTLYLVQAIAYLLFLNTIGTLYFQSLNPPKNKSVKSAPSA